MKLCIHINADTGFQFDGDMVIPDCDQLDPASHQRFIKFSKEGGLLRRYRRLFSDGVLGG